MCIRSVLFLFILFLQLKKTLGHQKSRLAKKIEEAKEELNQIAGHKSRSSKSRGDDIDENGYDSEHSKKDFVKSMEERNRLYEEKKASRQKRKEEKEAAERKAREDEEIQKYHRLLNTTIPEQSRRLTKAASEKARTVSINSVFLQVFV